MTESYPSQEYNNDNTIDIIKQYLHDIGTHEMLTHSEEKVLSLNVQKAQYLQSKLDRDSAYRTLYNIFLAIKEEDIILQHICKYINLLPAISVLIEPGINALHIKYDSELLTYLEDSINLSPQITKRKITNISLGFLCLPPEVPEIFRSFTVSEVLKLFSTSENFTILNTFGNRFKEHFNTILLVGEQSKQRMVNCNLRLVVSVARRIHFSPLGLMDRIQDGNLGLIKAVERFEPRLGYKFSTYGTWWIRQSITRGIADTSRMIRLPVHAEEYLHRIGPLIKEFQDLGEPDPTAEMIAKRLGIPITLVENIQRVNTVASLNRPSYKAETMSDPLDLIDLLDNTEGFENGNTETVAVNNIYSESLQLVLKKYLTPREEQVIVMRFGIPDGEISTLETIGKILGVTRERIRQIEARALRKLKEPRVKSLLAY